MQLAIRSGQYKTINVVEVYEGQLVSVNSFSGEYEFQEQRSSDEVVGYVAFLKLVTGFEKYLFWTVEQCKEHATKFSKSYSSQYKDSSLWVKDFNGMSKKTVLKMLLSKYGVLSVEMQTAIIADQGVLTDMDEPSHVDYPDNPKNDAEVTVQDENGNAIKVKESSQEKNQSLESSLKNKINSKPAPPSFVTYKEPSEPDNTEEEIAEIKAEFKEMKLTSYKDIQIAVLKINAKEKFPAEADFFATVSGEFPKELGEAIKG